MAKSPLRTSFGRRSTAILTAGALTISMAACSPGDNVTPENNKVAESGGSDSTSADSSKESTSTGDEKGTWPRTIETLNGDGDKVELEIKAQPKRIVSTSVTLTGALLSIDAPIIASGGTVPNTAVANGDGFFKQWADEAQQHDVRSLYQGDDINVEAIAAENPDLIVASAKGRDSAAKVYDKLSAIAPTVVIDYTHDDWQDLAKKLGEATGHSDAADATIKKYDARVKEVKDKISEPGQPVNFITKLPNGNINFFTEESAIGHVANDLGWSVASPDKELVAPNPQGKTRKDVQGVAAENIDKALTGKTIFQINVRGEGDPIAELKNNPLLAHNEALQNGDAYNLSAEFFRMDYYSAMKLLDKFEELFTK